MRDHGRSTERPRRRSRWGWLLAAASPVWVLSLAWTHLALGATHPSPVEGRASAPSGSPPEEDSERSKTGRQSGGAFPSEVAGGSALAGDESQRLKLLRRDIETLRRSVETLSGSEHGVLGELKAIEADALKKQEELATAEDALRRTEEDARTSIERSKQLEARLASMTGQVSARLAALYKLGRPRYLRVLLASEKPSTFLSAYRTASALSSRDARLVSTFRAENARARQEASRLAALQPLLEQQSESRRKAARGAELALERKRSLFRSVRSDRVRHEAALSELQAAERSVGRLLSGLPVAPTPALSLDRFRGLLDWPAAGRVSSPFGRTVNRKLGTALAHNGVDIDAPFGAEVRCIYDGTVVFAQWLRGYGLTVIVDHGAGWLSVYAHASVLLVEKGERVSRSRKIALVGDTASLQGAYLYFEIRKDGHPVDPVLWLRSRRPHA